MCLDAPITIHLPGQTGKLNEAKAIYVKAEVCSPTNGVVSISTHHCHDLTGAEEKGYCDELYIYEWLNAYYFLVNFTYLCMRYSRRVNKGVKYDNDDSDQLCIAFCIAEHRAIGITDCGGKTYDRENACKGC